MRWAALAGCGGENIFCDSPQERLGHKNRVVKILIKFILCYQKAWVGICNS